MENAPQFQKYFFYCRVQTSMTNRTLQVEACFSWQQTNNTNNWPVYECNENQHKNQHKTKNNWRPFHKIIVGSWHEDTHLNGASRSETVRSIQYLTGFMSALSRLRVIDDASVDNTIYYQWGIIQYWTTPTIRTFKPFLMAGIKGLTDLCMQPMVL